MLIGEKAPNFSLPSETKKNVTLNDFAGQRLVIFFYPRDDTSGCTKEAIAFGENLAEFSALNTSVIGVSKDTIKSHQKFITKHDLKIPLLSDEKDQMCEDYGVWKEKKMYGKTYLGIERSTFLIDENAKFAAIWNKVKVAGHVEDVLSTLKGL